MRFPLESCGFASCCENFNVKENILNNNRGFSLLKDGKILSFPVGFLRKIFRSFVDFQFTAFTDHCREHRVGDRAILIVSIEWNFQSLKPNSQ